MSTAIEPRAWDGDRGSQDAGHGRDTGLGNPSVSPRDLLIHQFDLVHATAASALEDVTGVQSSEQPGGNGSSATEILMRLLHVQRAALQLMGVDSVEGGDPPTAASLDPCVGAIDPGALATRFLAFRDRCAAGIAALSDEALTEFVVDPFGQPCRRAELLGSLANDQAYHVGQLDMALQMRMHIASGGSSTSMTRRRARWREFAAKSLPTAQG